MNKRINRKPASKKNNLRFFLLVFLIISVVGTLAFILLIVVASLIFTVEKYDVEIAQDIGGKLICHIQYGCDQHTCNYLIEYEYVDNQQKSSRIGYGSFVSREWDDSVQIQKLQNYLLLVTGDDPSNTVMIYVSDLHGDKWEPYSFTADQIVSEEVWRQIEGTPSPTRSARNKTEITRIDENGEIDVLFEFVDEGDETKRKLLNYKLVNGIPTLTGIRDM